MNVFVLMRVLEGNPHCVSVRKSWLHMVLESCSIEFSCASRGVFWNKIRSGRQACWSAWDELLPLIHHQRVECTAREIPVCRWTKARHRLRRVGACKRKLRCDVQNVPRTATHLALVEMLLDNQGVVGEQRAEMVALARGMIKRRAAKKKKDGKLLS